MIIIIKHSISFPNYFQHSLDQTAIWNFEPEILWETAYVLNVGRALQVESTDPAFCLNVASATHGWFMG